jgi:hypothetical protein
MTAVISGNFFLCKATVGILKQLYRTISVLFIESVVEAILSLYRSLARLPKRQKPFERDVGASLVFLATGEDLNMGGFASPNGYSAHTGSAGAGCVSRMGCVMFHLDT